MTEQPKPLNIAWGGRGIGRVLGKSERATFHLLEQGQVPGAVKIGNQWALDVDLFRKKIAEAAA